MTAAHNAGRSGLGALVCCGAPDRFGHPDRSDVMSDDLPPGHPLAPPPPSIDVLQDLATDARTLPALLEDAHPERSTWQAAVAEQLIADLRRLPRRRATRPA